jgi:Fe2+ or Zn2+ uptake regulation protein
LVPNDPAQTPGNSIRKRGLRLTPQRALIYQILQEAEEHLDAEGIWQRAQLQNADLNLATVYRTLNVLMDVGLINQSFLGEGQKRAFYEIASKPKHTHFACLVCGQVLELDSRPVSEAQKALELRNGVRILNVHLKFEGLCPQCLAASTSE